MNVEQRLVGDGIEAILIPVVVEAVELLLLLFLRLGIGPPKMSRMKTPRARAIDVQWK
ncbi:MAG: hypothetical protein R3E12_08910 [Candidatus Eisenbacteria bacterium]